MVDAHNNNEYEKKKYRPRSRTGSVTTCAVCVGSCSTTPSGWRNTGARESFTSSTAAPSAIRCSTARPIWPLTAGGISRGTPSLPVRFAIYRQICKPYANNNGTIETSHQCFGIQIEPFWFNLTGSSSNNNNAMEKAPASVASSGTEGKTISAASILHSHYQTVYGKASSAFYGDFNGAKTSTASPYYAPGAQQPQQLVTWCILRHHAPLYFSLVVWIFP